jgi:hypothetical protein
MYPYEYVVSMVRNKGVIYLDWNETTPDHPEVVKAMIP